jgi:hypothetical protein
MTKLFERLFSWVKTGPLPPSIAEPPSYISEPSYPPPPRRVIPYDGRTRRTYADASAQTDSSIQSRKSHNVMTDPLPFSLDLFEEPESPEIRTVVPRPLKFPAKYGFQQSGPQSSSFSVRNPVPPPDSSKNRTSQFIFKSQSVSQTESEIEHEPVGESETQSSHSVADRKLESSHDGLEDETDSDPSTQGTELSSQLQSSGDTANSGDETDSSSAKYHHCF